MRLSEISFPETSRSVLLGFQQELLDRFPDADIELSSVKGGDSRLSTDLSNERATIQLSLTMRHTSLATATVTSQDLHGTLNYKFVTPTNGSTHVSARAIEPACFTNGDSSYRAASWIAMAKFFSKELSDVLAGL